MNLKKKYAYGLFGFLIILSVVAMGMAYGGDQPSVFGHSIGELEDVQKRVSESCSTGESIRVINADGTVECELDDMGSGGTIQQIIDGEGISVINAGSPDVTISLSSPTSTSLGGVKASNCGSFDAVNSIDSSGNLGCSSLLTLCKYKGNRYTPGSKCRQNHCIDTLTRNRANVFLCRTDGSWLDTGFHDNSCGLPLCG